VVYVDRDSIQVERRDHVEMMKSTVLAFIEDEARSRSLRSPSIR